LPLRDGEAVLDLYSFSDVRVGPQIAYQLVLATALQLLAFQLLVRGRGLHSSAFQLKLRRF
jgi:hypothetical protein